MRAASRGYADIVSMLVDAGASVNIKDKYGKTALSYATQRGHQSIIKILKDAGAK